jgi:inositol phosphorylceramide mannosyltransferase catalytic subunit
VEIPRVFHFVWVDGSPKIPRRFLEFTRGWKRQHPGWEAEWWYRPLEAMRNQDLWDRAGELCPGFEGQLRSDALRLEVLLEHGGVYLDVDFECLRNIEALVDKLHWFAAWEIEGRVANNAILGAVPGHPFTEWLVQGLARSVLERPGLRPSQSSGPHFLTRELRTWAAACDETPAAWAPPGDGHKPRILRQADFYPVGCKELDRLGRPEEYPDAYAVHWWNNQHRLKGRTL